MASDPAYAVLMGDIVASERHPDVQALHTSFNAAIDRQNAVNRAAMASPLTITLGDEFQGLFVSFVAAAHVAREVRFELMREGIDCRFVVGCVAPKTVINTERAWNMMGPGFADARALLEDKRAPSRYRFRFPHDALIETMSEAIGASLSAIERAWSDTQREAIVTLLGGATVAEVANARKVSIYTVYKVRAAGAFDLYAMQWRAMQAALTDLDRRYHLPGADAWGTHSFTPQ